MPRVPRPRYGRPIGASSPYFDVDLDLEPDRALLRLRGELDLAARPALVDAFERAEAAGRPRLEVDLEELSYIDSTGVATLLAAQRRAQAGARRLVVRRPRGAVARVFELMDVPARLPVVAA